MNLTLHRSRGDARPSRSGRLLAAGVSLALATTLAGVTAPSASADPVVGGTFSTSFETSQPQSLPGTAYGTLTNVTGKKFSPGSLLGLVSAVTASGENAPTELAVNAADGVASSKWLVRTNTGWLQYQLSSAKVAKQYKLTTANDTWGRDPKNWKVLGSNDGTTWTDLDTQTDQLTNGVDSGANSNRMKTYTYDMSSNSTAYSYYRLDISANNGQPLIQLADFEILDGTTNPAAAAPLQTKVGTGPVSAPVAKTGAGFTGKASMQYVGAHMAAGAASGAGVLFDNQDIAIGDSSQLSYLIFPILDTGDLTYPATYTALDLVLEDGSRVSTKGLVDTNGFDFNARAYGQEKALYGSQWNKVTVDLGGLAGHTIKKILLAYDNPDGAATTAFSGWLDDVKIADATARDTSAGLVSYVDTRRGTNANGSFSRGNNLPITAMPNGFNFFTPMTKAESSDWEYSYQNPTYVDSNTNANKLNGIGISHEPSPWMGDRNQVVFMPDVNGTGGSGNLDSRAKTYSHDTEIARPDYYSVVLDGGNLKAEVAPTDHGAVIRYTDSKSGDASMRSLVDVANGDGSFNVDATGKLTGWVDAGSGLSAGRSRMFIAGQYNATPSTTTAGTGRTNSKITVVPLDANKQVELRVATSFISQDQAQLNLDREVTGKTFGDVRAAAAQAWNDRLSVVDLSGSNATDTQKVTTYSNLYRLNLYPNSQSEDTSELGSSTPVWKYASPVADKVGSATDTQTNAQIKDGQIYVNNGFWDTYRTVWPLYSFLYPDVAQKLVDGFVQQYRDGGWIARWSSPGYADLMTGTSSDASFAEAYTSGALDTATALEAYDAALKNATVLSPNNGTGRKGLNKSIFLGYTPSSTGESVSWGLEGLINDNAMADMALKLSTDPAVPAARQAQLAEEAKYFSSRSDDFVNLFDPSVGFFQGRTEAGTFGKSAATYDPTDWTNGDYTETDGWNFAFHAPYDVEGLAALYGGQQGLLDKLDEFFSTPETGTSRSIHETKEARDVRMGQFGMSNQVSHHIPWIYAAAGDPSKTQEKVREVLQRLFVGSEIGQGYPGDEDNGEMSSWQIFASLGFYPLALGSGEFTIGSPLYDHVVVHRANGDLTINAAGNDRDHVYVASAQLDGTALTTASLSQAALNASGDHTLAFTMSTTPTTWGDRTFSAQRPTPLVDIAGSDYSTASASDGSSLGSLLDNSSSTSGTFATATPTLTFTAKSVAAPVKTYTITNGASGSTPKSWKLEGSNNGSTWTTLDTRTDETFRWATQTRPFQVASPAQFSRYRLVVTATSDGDPATVSELELLAGQVQASELSVIPTSSATSVGVTASTAYALIAGGASQDAADYTATVDFLDGNGPQAATVTPSGLGLTVTLPHSFTTTGVHSLPVSVTEDGSTVTGVSTVTVTRDQAFESLLNNACITVPGVAADCDGNGYGYRKESLASTGFVQGTTITVPGKGVSFDLPDIPAGQNDNLISTNLPVRINVGADATKVSFIGMANEKDQTRTITLTYADGHTQDVEVSFDNWDDNPATFSTNVEVGSSTGRYSGTSGSSTSGTFRMWSTDPVTVDPGHGAPLWLTMSAKPDTTKAQLHIFAVASDGTRTAPTPLTAAASTATVPAAYAGSPVTAELATFAGGDSQANAYSASVNWGDDTALVGGVVASGKVSGTHTYAQPGTYTVTVTVDDGVHSTVTTRQVTVEAKVASTVSVAGPSSNPTTTTTAALTATVPNDATGTVEFFEGSTSLGTATISNGKAVLNAGPLGAGAHSVTATYQGDAKYEASTSSAVTVTVVKTAAAVTLNASPGTPVVSSSFTLSATVTAGATGSVEFFDGAASLGTATISGGVATKTVTAPATVGSKQYKATYAGDATYATATSTTITVNFSATPATISLTTSATTATPVSGPTLTATLTTGATGTVEFFDGATSLGVVTVASSKATKALSGLAVGAHTITAVYSGDSTYGGATSSTVTIVSSLATSSVALTTSPASVTPLTTVTLTAALTGPTTGTVEFYDGATKVGQATAAAGAAVMTLSGLTVGSHSFTAKFVADSSYAGSTSPAKAVTVTKVATVTTLSSNVSSVSTLGQVTFTAKVTPAGGTGNVEFREGATVLGTKAVTASQNEVTLTVSGLAGGSHSVTAVYVGDGSYATSTSSPVTVTVNKASATLTLTADATEREAIGSSVLTAHLSDTGATGTVEFREGATVLGQATVSGGTATLTVGDLETGTHTISAVYAGDDKYLGSTSPVLDVTVTPSAATVVLSASDASITDAGAVDLMVSLRSGATGTVEILDGGTSLATVPVSGGAATFTATGLAVGSHSITAVYSGDEHYAQATSEAVVVTVTASVVPKTEVTLDKPVFSTATSVYNAKTAVTVSTKVTGATVGTVTFKSGTTVLGAAPVVGGRATLTLAKKLAVGSYVAVASIAETETTAAAVSVASGTLTVTKAALKKLKVKAKGKSYAKGHSFKVVVKAPKALTSGRKALGKVKVSVGKKVAKTFKAKKLRTHGGKVTVTVPARFATGKKLKITAKFTPRSKATTLVTKSKAVKVKAAKR